VWVLELISFSFRFWFCFLQVETNQAVNVHRHRGIPAEREQVRDCYPARIVCCCVILCCANFHPPPTQELLRTIAELERRLAGLQGENTLMQHQIDNMHAAAEAAPVTATTRAMAPDDRDAVIARLERDKARLLKDMSVMQQLIDNLRREINHLTAQINDAPRDTPVAAAPAPPAPAADVSLLLIVSRCLFSSPSPSHALFLTFQQTGELMRLRGENALMEHEIESLHQTLNADKALLEQLQRDLEAARAEIERLASLPAVHSTITDRVVITEKDTVRERRGECV
jgi:septal ring factor EnvC (AmiA/AmiB activator)